MYVLALFMMSTPYISTWVISEIDITKYFIGIPYLSYIHTFILLL